ncbi:MAG: 5-deoxy-glucuronate isomerase [Bacteroidota bacterium]|nr:5-deoxy-glucuronate isomerase [Bacteroidota bacterium]MDE2956568.1 5-deoxy-glucuronate isomerase [Bacteroidota bacterium]
MIASRLIGNFVTTPPLSPNARRSTGRAVVLGREKLRSAELFDTRPVLNAREEIITGDNSSFRYLRMARIALQPEAPGYTPIRVTLPPNQEAVFYVNRGRTTLTTQAGEFDLEMGDVVYAGIGESVEVRCDHELADVSEYRAIDCHTRHPTCRVRHSDIEGTPLAADVGTKRPMTRRTVYKLVDQNIQACRLLFGDTFMQQPGGVGSYPPHFHGPDGPSGLGRDAKEEIYHFRCASVIPGAIPYVLQNCARPLETLNTYVHLFDEQAINVTPNYHDTMAPPTVDFMFVWCLGAYTENERDWARIVTQPGFEDEW